MSETFTIVGAGGFIGSHLVAYLRDAGHACATPPRDAPLPEGDLGHVVYCAGLTGDIRNRPLEGMEAHGTTLAEILRAPSFTSLLYLSSTRVYDRHGEGMAREDDELRVRPDFPEDLFAVSKLAGEALALRAGGRVARLANVYGRGHEAHSFLATVVRQAVRDQAVVLESALASTRDYVAVDDVVRALAAIALRGEQRIYNVASGELVTNGEIADVLAAQTGCTVDVQEAAPRVGRPQIDSSRLRTELGIEPVRLLEQLAALIADERRR